MEDFIFDNFGKIILILIALACWGIPKLDELACDEKTKGMGVQVEWSLLGGCRVEYQEGKWIPLDRYRIVEE